MIGANTGKAGPFTCNGVTTLYPFTFPITTTNGSDIQVWYSDSNGNISLITSNYRVVLTDPLDPTGGGNVEYPYPSGTVPSSGKITLLRNVTAAQTADFKNWGGNNWQACENVLDKIMMIVQQCVERVSRALVGPVTSTSFEYSIPEANPGKALCWNATGTAIVNQDFQASANNFTTSINSTMASGPPVICVSNDECTNLRAADATQADSILETGPGGLNVHKKVIEIGDWDMDSSIIVYVTHGLDYTKIIDIQVSIRSDDGSNVYNSVVGFDAIRWNSTNIALVRTAGGFFDSTDFNATSYNRGYVVINYTD